MLIFLEDFTLFAFIYLFCFLGAFSKDMIDTFSEKTTEVLIIKVLISSLAVAILLYGTSEYLLDRFSYRFFTTLCYTLGLVSFEVLVRYSSAASFLELLDEFGRWRKNEK
ncbi:hypothetical protein [Natronincola ferrireducens]|uniref:Uncharacterized protein n=1 Tax=Natronincola ferrireducens TaxID=393762 RepID=A0A1G9IDC7_9FIRM|nr:hypothetical protein [Natronincola ferrireducens]SDL23116.1 hypothetical protein SAMN05660472_02834 [Natronincola ferrireducens]